MEVFVIRHTPVALSSDTCYGQSEVPLADTFLADAAQLKSKLPADFDHIYCSPLLRCTDLAAALGYEQVTLDPALMEMNFGEWENKKWNDLNQGNLNYWMADFVQVKTPRGENLVELFERVKGFADQLRKQPHQKILIITHAGVIRCLWAYLLDIPLQNIFKIPVSYGETLVLNLKASKALDSIKKLNFT